MTILLVANLHRGLGPKQAERLAKHHVFRVVRRLHEDARADHAPSGVDVLAGAAAVALLAATGTRVRLCMRLLGYKVNVFGHKVDPSGGLVGTGNH